MPITSSQDFDGNFTMDVGFGKHYEDVSWCRPNGALGCAGEYWEDDAGCDLEENDIVVYYYDNSLLVDGESNAWQHAVNDLTMSYLYEIVQDDGDLVVLKTDIYMHNTAPYLVGKSNADGSKAVFIGGYHPDELKKYADSVEFK